GVPRGALRRAPQGAERARLRVLPMTTNDWTQIEGALAGWIGARRWYRTKTRRIEGARVARTFPLGDRAAILFVDVAFEGGGDPDTYVLPVARLAKGDAAGVRPEAIVHADERDAWVDGLQHPPLLLALL